MKPDTRLLLNPVALLATGMGIGFIPIMPGTFGSLLAFPLIAVVGGWSLGVAITLVTVMSVAGVYLCGAASRLLGADDHGSIVWDEVCGCLLALLAAPPGWMWWGAAFVLFRIFDIWKPWPVSWLDNNVGGGLGVMLDDIAAGAMAAAVLLIARFLVVAP